MSYRKLDESGLDASGAPPAMPTSRKLLCAVYPAISIAALIGTWSQNAAYVNSITGYAAKDFVLDTKLTAASRSIMVDLMLVTIAGVIFMVVEGRKRRIPFFWAYVAVAALVAMSVAFPLFLLARELRSGPTDPDRIKAVDVVLLSVMCAAAGGLAIFAVL